MDCFRQGHFPVGEGRVYQRDGFSGADLVIPGGRVKVTFMGGRMKPQLG